MDTTIVQLGQDLARAGYIPLVLRLTYNALDSNSLELGAKTHHKITPNLSVWPR